MCTSKLNNRTDEQENQQGITITDADGNQYFIFGKSRIKITEHFKDNGKSIDDLISDLIQIKIKETATRIA